MFYQWLFPVPVKGGIGGIVHPPIGRKNTTYIPLIVLAFWGVKKSTYHLLREPETTIDFMLFWGPPSFEERRASFRGVEPVCNLTSPAIKLIISKRMTLKERCLGSSPYPGFQWQKGVLGITQ